MGDAVQRDQLVISLQREPNSRTVSNGGPQLHDQPLVEHKHYSYRIGGNYPRCIPCSDYEWDTFVRLT